MQLVVCEWNEEQLCLHKVNFIDRGNHSIKLVGKLASLLFISSLVSQRSFIRTDGTDDTGFADQGCAVFDLWNQRCSSDFILADNWIWSTTKLIISDFLYIVQRWLTQTVYSDILPLIKGTEKPWLLPTASN